MNLFEWPNNIWFNLKSCTSEETQSLHGQGFQKPHRELNSKDGNCMVSARSSGYVLWGLVWAFVETLRLGGRMGNPLLNLETLLFQ